MLAYMFQEIYHRCRLARNVCPGSDSVPRYTRRYGPDSRRHQGGTGCQGHQAVLQIEHSDGLALCFSQIYSLYDVGTSRVLTINMCTNHMCRRRNRSRSQWHICIDCRWRYTQCCHPDTRRQLGTGRHTLSSTLHT